MKSVNNGVYSFAFMMLIAGTIASAEHTFQGYNGQALQSSEVAIIEIRRPTALYSINGDTAYRSKGDVKTIGEVLPKKYGFTLVS